MRRLPAQRRLPPLLLVAAFTACRSRADPPRAAPSALPVASSSASRAELAILAPLVPGSPLGGFTVEAIQPVHRGRVRVVCVRDHAVVHLDVALARSGTSARDAGPEPAAATARYNVFYALRGGASPEDGAELASLLARTLAANASVPPPPDMATFTPAPDPGTTL